MSVKSRIAAVFAATLLTTTAVLADGIMVKDPYARSSRPNAPVGGVFMTLMNHTGQDDRLIGARSDLAKRVELHTHIDKGEGVMQMVEIEGGIALPAGGMHGMKRGGDHVMLMGLTQPLVQGEMISLTLEFEKAGDVTVEVPVDSERKPATGEGHSGHSGHSDH